MVLKLHSDHELLIPLINEHEYIHLQHLCTYNLDSILSEINLTHC